LRFCSGLRTKWFISTNRHRLTRLGTSYKKIDQRYWECKSELSRETHAAPKADGKAEKTGKVNPQQDCKQNSNSNLNSNNTASGSKEKDKTKSNPPQQKKPDLTGKLGTDGKLLPAERQRRLDNDLCLLCGKGGHVVRDCPRSAKARAAKASETKTSDAKASEAKK
jgi:hypothetical protein